MKNWFLTLNNPSAYELYQFFDIINDVSAEPYNEFVGGLEGTWDERDDSTECHTRHLQICFRTKKDLKFKEIKCMWPRAHIEPALDINKCICYCMKEGLYFRYDSHNKKYLIKKKWKRR